MEEQRFYKLNHGWATKYYWFTVIEEIDPSTPPFDEMIKKGKFTFSKQSGTTPADIHGSTMAINFYSQRFIDFLKVNGVKNISAYKLKFVPKLQYIGNYYYVEPISILKRVALEDSVHSSEEKELARKKVREALKSHRVIYLNGSEELAYTRSYIDISSWNGSGLCGVSDSRTIIVTQKLKEKIEHAKLKNAQFEEILPFTLEDLKQWEKKVKVLDQQ